VADWLEETLPREASGGRDGWNDLAMTAYQFGCDALVRLGRAREAPWGASRLAAPIAPDVYPRWDDICVVVLSLADQQGLISYRQADGSVAPPRGTSGVRITRLHPRPTEPPEPNIAAAHGCGPARADEGLLPVLNALGLTKDAAWTQAAEFALWREQPRAWDLDVPSDPRFALGLVLALASLPQDIGDALAALADPQIPTMAEQEARNAVYLEELGFPPNPRSGKLTAEGVRASALFVAETQIDDLFYARWRLLDGWLTADDPEVMNIFHDPLARQMRHAVVAHLHSDSPIAQEPRR